MPPVNQAARGSMDESRRKRVEELFQRCVSLPPSEWKRYLEAHSGDPAVRDDVVELLLKDAAAAGESGRLEPSRQTEDPGRAPAEPGGSDLASTRPASPGADLPDPATVGESDVFISYAAGDDQPPGVEREGWVSRLHRNLEVRVEQISGKRARIWRYPGPVDTAGLDDRWLASVPGAKTLLAVVSPRFVASRGCQRQVEVFQDSAERAGNLRLETGSRVFKVVKRPVPVADMPPRLAGLFASLLDYEFHELDLETGKARDHEEACGQTAVQRYHDGVYDLARDICAALRTLREGDESGLPATSGATIYLATTTPDVEPQRNRVRRQLLARGHTVLPDRPLPCVEAVLVAAVDEYLERCEFAVHTIGGLYGVVPEGTDRSLLEVENRLAAGHAARRGLNRLIWIPRGIDVRDPRQERWLEGLRADPAQHEGAEIIEDRFDTFKALLLRRLAEQAEHARSPGRERPPRAYLICDRRDEKAVAEMEDFFFERGVEVSRPPFEASEAEALESHLESLRQCDAAVIYYGAADRRWVESHLRELSKATGYRASGAIPVQFVYLAPPFDRAKQRFKSPSVEVLRQGEQLNPRILDSLVVRILEARSDE